MILKKIGETHTDKNGKTILPYTGKGLGKIQILAKTGTLTTDTQTITDALFYDPCTNGIEKWSGADYRVNATSSDDGIRLAGLEGFYTFWANPLGGSERRYADEFAVEFAITDMDTITRGAVLQIYDGVADDTQHLVNITLGMNYATSDCQVKLTYLDDTVNYYVDDTLKLTRENVHFTDKFRIGFRGYENWILQFKDFRIYPI